jgi:hypothetical protein
MASNINATKPTTGSPTTQSVRDNFSAAKDEINSLLRSSLDVVTTAGTGTAYTANFTNNVVKANGARIIVKAHTANTASASLNVDGTGASTIKNMNGTNLSANQIGGANHYLDLIYNSGNNTWVLLNPAKHVIPQSGVTNLSTDLTTLSTNLGAKLNSTSYTAADVLAKLVTVDGSGTGLDADKIDGYNIVVGSTGTDADTIYFET